MTITTAQLRELWLWARVTTDGGHDDDIGLVVADGDHLFAAQGDRTAEWDRDGNEVDA